MDLRIGLPLITAGIAVVMDIKNAKVDNGWLLFMLVTGFFTEVYARGVRIIPEFVLGLLFPFILLIGLYYFRMLGPGDIKLLCVLGGMVGTGKIGALMLASLFSGGMIALFLLIFTVDVRERIEYLLGYIQDLACTGKVKPYYKKGMPVENFHFTVPVFLAVVLYAGGVI